MAAFQQFGASDRVGEKPGLFDEFADREPGEQELSISTPELITEFLQPFIVAERFD